MDKQEYNKIGREVVKKYKEDILPKCARFEEERIKIKNRSYLVLCLAFLVSVMFFFFPGLISVESALKITLIIFVVAFGLNYIWAKSFELEVKQSVMRYFCSCFGDLKWAALAENIVDDNFIAQSNLFKTNQSSQYDYDDIFKGSFRDVNFEIIELESYTVTRTVKGRKNRTRQFKGAIIKIKIDKTFNSNTVIRPDSFMHFSPDLKLKHTTLEDVQFERKFDVFTTDEVEARYLITTAFMDRLNNLKMAFNIDKISCAFYNQNLLIGLHTNKDLFKFASIGKSLFDYSEFSKLFKEIMSIYEMIDYFKFGEKTKI